MFGDRQRGGSIHVGSLNLPIIPTSVSRSFPDADSQNIHQTPAVVSSSPGDELELKCTVQGTTNPDMYWYRQDSGKGLRFMFYSTGTAHINPEEPVDGFTAKRPSDTEFNLNTSSLRVDHSAVYYCAWSIHSDTDRGSSSTKTPKAAGNTCERQSKAEVLPVAFFLLTSNHA
ncbi:hypothetical protein chiPu_0012172 [Chiloscyllium punctatum]|uniref:Ig-like domain-containing protein n=1 Tax=Chiloscyllium punctatum TaxID=137246 RepID=A0A401STK4_CHIPU|nr:hypothetical protein [Chiloscyllium punctatum]